MKNLRTAVLILSVVVSTFVIVLAGLQLSGVWSEAVNVFVPLLGVQSLCHAYLQWNVHRSAAWISLIAAVVVLVCSAVVFFLP